VADFEIQAVHAGTVWIESIIHQPLHCITQILIRQVPWEFSALGCEYTIGVWRIRDSTAAERIIILREPALASLLDV